MKNYTIISIWILCGLLVSCDKPEDWQDAPDNIAPGRVSEVAVENLNGGARITYRLPGDKDLLGVKAVYSLSDGVSREAFSSAFRDTILLEGYATTDEQVVRLITVDKSRNESEPVEVQIKPLEPPINLIRQTLSASPTFGGIYAQWENPFEEELAINLYTVDSLGDYTLFDTYYSKQPSGGFAFRGLENLSQNLRVEIRDRWNNYSAPLDTVLTPLFEQQIVGRDQNGFIWQQFGWDDRTVLYRGDVATQHSSASQRFPYLHDGVEFSESQYWNSGPVANRLADYVDWPDPEEWVMPMYFTLDMGREASYSRLRYWVRARQPIFSGFIFTKFEVWGTNHPKPLNEIGDGSREANLQYWTEWPQVGGTDEWKNDWVKLVDGEVKLPSGETDPNLLTQEDRDYVAAGFEFEMDPQYGDQSFRYLRFVLKETNIGLPHFMISEIKFWGAYK